jgi:tRNA(fMet)-specific endonuclease VapC
MLILDTDLLTIVQRGEGVAYDCLAARLDQAAESVCVTIISVEEQMRGWLAYIARKRTVSKQVEGYARLHELFQDFGDRPVLEFGAEVASRYEQLRRSKVRIGAMDLKIAAIALAHDALLLSRNLRDYQKVPGLRVEDWTVPAGG